MQENKNIETETNPKINQKKIILALWDSITAWYNIKLGILIQNN